MSAPRTVSFGSKSGFILLATMGISAALIGDANAQGRRRRRGRAPAAAPASTASAPAADAQTAGPVAPNTQATAPLSIVPIPLGANESAGNRIARARSLMDQIEFAQVLALLAPLRNAPGLPPALGVEAALLETNAFVALQQNEQAVDACKRAVVLANYDPEVGRDQPPRVQSICRSAGEQARQELAATRGLRVASSNVVVGEVAYTPIRIEADISGDLTGLTTQAEVTVGTAAPLLVNMPGSGAGPRVAVLDANYATPGVRIQVTPIVRDQHGILLRAAAPGIGVVPTNEAAVRFAAGSDEGPLRVDGRPSSVRVRAGLLVPLPAGAHDLHVRSVDGIETSTHITLRRGEVALLTLRGVAGSSFRAIAKIGSTGVAVLLLGTGAVFQFLAYTSARELERNSMQVDPSSGLPTIRFGDVETVYTSIQSNQNLATGFFIGGGVFTALAAIFWALPSGSTGSSDTATAARARARSLSFGISPSGVSLGGRF